MCDTLIVPPAASALGVTLLAKNSDRERDEAQQVLALPARSHARGAGLRCTHVEIPQVRHTRAVLLSRPWWMWGAEMGANDAGVAIGNEALFTREQAGSDALLGMDLLRLALERAGSAAEAVEVITGLLERHGQGGNCAVHRDFRYDNGFAIADPHEAWILETCGRHWVVRRVEDLDAISNIASTGSNHERTSGGAFDAFRANGWLRDDEPDDFARAVTDPERTAISNGGGRCSRARDLLQSLDRPLTPMDLMAMLRDHGGDPDWRPDDLDHPSTLCMHAGGASARLSQTTGSMVSVLHPGSATHFLTGTAAPCTSLFRPTWVDALPAEFDPPPTGDADPRSLFWRHEQRHRHALRDLPTALRAITEQQAAYENTIIEAALAMRDAPQTFRQDFAGSAFRLSERLLAEWGDRWAGLSVEAQHNGEWRAEWARVDARSGLADPGHAAPQQESSSE